MGSNSCEATRQPQGKDSLTNSNMDMSVNVPVDDPNADTEWYGDRVTSLQKIVSLMSEMQE